MEEQTTPNSANQPTPADPINQPKKSNKSKIAIPIIAGIVLLSGVGAAAFNASVQNTPAKIWQDALQNTADGFDSVVEDAQDFDYKGGTVDGSFKLSSPLSVDGKITGKWYEKNAQFESSLGLSGVRVETDLRSIGVENSDTPDIYVNIKGLEPVQSMFGDSQPQVNTIIEQINGKWILIDRTLIGQGLEEIEGQVGVDQDAVMLDENELKEISEKSAEVLRDYVFSDSEKAVFRVAEEVGEEELDGVATYKYVVEVDKDNLKAFAVAYKDALKETEFDEYTTAMSGDEKTFEETINFDELLESIEEIDFSQSKNEAWVDLDKRLIRNVRITPTEQDPGTIGYIEMALPYDGGDVLPFTLRINTGTEEATGDALVAEFVAAYNKEDTSFDLSFAINGTINEQKISTAADLSISPSNDKVTVEKPDGAINVLEIIGQLNGSLDLDAISNQSALPLNQLRQDGVEL